MKTIEPRKPLRGEITVPGDKSISHRAIMLASLADSPVEVKNFGRRLPVNDKMHGGVGRYD